MAAYKGSTGLEYTRTVDEADEQKQRMTASIDRMYSIATYVFAIGLIAVGALCGISILNNAPKIAIAFEAVVFICLIALLILIGRAKRRISEQRRHSERYPYKSVDKKEIDNIFDIIADEEKKRERLDRFASSGTSSSPSFVPDKKKDNKPSEPAKVSREIEPVDRSENQDDAEEDSGMIPIFPDQEEEMVSVLDDEKNDVEIKIPMMEDTEEKPKEEKTPSETLTDKQPDEKAEDVPEEKAARSDEDAPRKKRPRPDGSRPPQSGKRPPQGQKGKRPPSADGAYRDPRSRSASQQQGAPKRRRPPAHDPYYGGAYYYDEYGRPIRRPVPYDPYYGGGYYYDEYGQPVRRREPAYGPEGAVYYDEYGRPIRRRQPQGDPRREEAMRRKRPASPNGEPAKRRPDAKTSTTARGDAPAKKPGTPAGPQPESRRTAAPVAMPSLKKDFDEEHIAVYIPYDDDRDSSYEDANQNVVLKADRQSASRSKVPSAPQKPVNVDESEYSPRDVEAVPIVIPDDDYFSRYDDEEQVYTPPASSAPSRSNESRSHQSPAASNRPDYYYEEEDIPLEDRDTGVVVVPEFDDYDEDEYNARYARGRYRSSDASQNEQAYQPPVKKQNTSSNAVGSVEEEEYTYEDEGVIVLPHDEGYESYLEKVKEEEERKRIEERKLARKQSGKIALTIRKVRRKKIKRMSRKYKRFRASVIPLAKYLSVLDS